MYLLVIKLLNIAFSFHQDKVTGVLMRDSFLINITNFVVKLGNNLQSYSILNPLTGFEFADLTDCITMVPNAMTTLKVMAIRNIHQ